MGKVTFGYSYKAYLRPEDAFVVKRLKGPRAFGKEKIVELGGTVHENLMPLKAYYYAKDETLLICDYIPGGSLSDLLHGREETKRTNLSWQVRHIMAYGVARGIEYLHSQGPESFHGNIRSSNVLLTHSFDAPVSDYGIAQLLSPDPKLNYFVGDRAPEVSNVHKVSQKADVYSFGVLLLELLTGKAPNQTLDLPKWVRLMVQEKPLFVMFDQKLLEFHDIEEEMFQMLQLAICCTFQYPNNRPSIAVVVNRIREICYSGS
ncbi:probable inactive receptor kinase RLK902 isoform X2 [Actinidia eriantha]|uniref:probable inactive receptor kinase RLK902 isoform X2 n=1 Tax=Actinidia eriantha TaxID=165200 RepID=UPI00258B8F9E|nr:probable inactive receptor kinase RLK902 isoform X2 [Actinidia eriantha]